jgi:SPP1 gp7 family putative phage head morphogenesis protein
MGCVRHDLGHERGRVRPPEPRRESARYVRYLRSVQTIFAAGVTAAAEDGTLTRSELEQAWATATTGAEAFLRNVSARVTADDAAFWRRLAKGRAIPRALGAPHTRATWVRENLALIADVGAKQIDELLAAQRAAPERTDARDPKQVDAKRKANVGLIGGTTPKQRSELTSLFRAAQATGQRHETLIESVQRITGAGEKRARLIARDQTVKHNAAVRQETARSLGVTRYVWRSSGDEAVRLFHKKLNGETFSYADPPVTDAYGHRNNPGEDYNCRCVDEPVIDLFAGLGGPDLSGSLRAQGKLGPKAKPGKTPAKPKPIAKPVAPKPVPKPVPKPQPDPRIEAERVAKLEAERLTKLEAERVAKLEAERLTKLEAERLTKLEAERIAKLEAERIAKLEAERIAKLEAERLVKEKAKPKKETAREARQRKIREINERYQREAEEAARKRRERAAKFERAQEERLARAREAGAKYQHPIRERAQALATAAADLKQPANQASIRDAMRKQVAAALPEARSRDIEMGTLGRDVIYDKPDAVLGAHHDWTGEVAIGSAIQPGLAQAMQELAAGIPVSKAGRDAVHVMLHEELHGHSRLMKNPYAYRDVGKVLEEVGTELHARKLAEELLGVPATEGAYFEYIAQVTDAIGAIEGRDTLDVIRDAHKANSLVDGPGFDSAEAMLNGFVRQLPVSAARRAEIRAKLAVLKP